MIRPVLEVCCFWSQMEFPTEFYDAIDAILLVLDSEGRIQRVNRNCLEAAGYAEDEVLGRPIWEVFFRPSEQSLVMGFFEEARTPPFRTTHEHPWQIHQEGTRRVSFTIAGCPPSADAEFWVVTALDVTGLRQTESELWSYRIKLEEMVEQRTDELQVSQKRFSGILDTAEDGIISVGSDQNIILFNRGAERIFGYTSDEVLGQPLSLLLPRRFQQGHEKLIAGFGRSGPASQSMSDRGEIYGRRKDGTEFDAEANISQLEVGGEKIFTAILRDITERKEMERQVRESLHEKEVLLREIHHRVKNNLQVISSLFTLQSRNVKDETILNILKDSQHRIQSMALIHEKIYQSDSLVRVPFDQYIRELSMDIMQSYQTVAAHVNLRFELEAVKLDIDTAIPCALILNELISNSLKHAFSGRDSGTLTLCLSCPEPTKLCVAVCDDGVGLPDESLLQTSKSLGLRLVRILTQQLTGEVRVLLESGTCFEFQFPLKA
jgi:PAS domain S-box-containing protein